MAVSPHQPDRFYMGSQFLHKSEDMGDTWEIISPDLTTNDPAKQNQAESGGLSMDNSGAENHTTIFTITESKRVFSSLFCSNPYLAALSIKSL